MTEREFETFLAELLQDSELIAERASGDFDEITHVRTFEQAGVLTGNRGLVVRLVDGTEFQVPIVRSR